jgi:hypothetical protein
MEGNLVCFFSWVDQGFYLPSIRESLDLHLGIAKLQFDLNSHGEHNGTVSGRI